MHRVRYLETERDELREDGWSERQRGSERETGAEGETDWGAEIK